MDDNEEFGLTVAAIKTLGEKSNFYFKGINFREI